MPLGILDLSIVTHRLLTQLKAHVDASKLWDEDPASKFTIGYTGLAPEAARDEKNGGECQLSVYLFHVAADAFHRNTHPLGGSAQTNATQPFALTLYYLLTAYAQGSYVKEQQAMSVALKCFHENPILPVDTDNEEFTLTIEPQTIDEISRLWQAITAPIRLSAIYRVSVIFLETPAPHVSGVVRHVPDMDVQPLSTVPPATTLPGAIARANADAAGFATVSIDDAGFAPGVTELKIRARPLARTTSPPRGGQFRIVDAETLALRVPLYTPEGTYVLTARPDPDQLKVIEIELDVPEQVVIVEVVAGIADVIIDDAGFAGGVTTARIGDAPGTALVEVNTPTIGAGRFRVVGPEALRLRIPGGIPSGRHLLTLGRGPAQPDLELWLRVP